MRWMSCWWRWHHGGRWCQCSISAHFNALAWGTDRWYLLRGEGAKCFIYQVRMSRNHVLPADSLHYICGVTAKDLINWIEKIDHSQLKFQSHPETLKKNMFSNNRNLRINEINSLGFKLICAVKIGEYQRFSCSFYWQIHAQCFFAHYLQLLQSILKIVSQYGVNELLSVNFIHLTLSAAARRSSAIFSKFGALPV